jgi:hypothetical protein
MVYIVDFSLLNDHVDRMLQNDRQSMNDRRHGPQNGMAILSFNLQAIPEGFRLKHTHKVI